VALRTTLVHAADGDEEEREGELAEGVKGQCGKFEFNALVDRKPVKMLNGYNS